MSKGPWKKKNLLVADALRDEGDPESDIDDVEPETETVAPVAPVAVAAPVAPAPGMPISMSLNDLQALMSTVTSGNADLANAVTKGIADAREPIPENKISPGISSANPLGDKKHPRPGLKCKMTFGTQDAKTQVVTPSYPLDADDLTVYEQIALNTLAPIHTTIQLLDGATIKLSVVPELDRVTDEITKLTLVIPGYVTEKKSAIKNMLPSPLNIVTQLTGRDYSKLSHDDLAWFMAEHRAKRFVSERETVAA